MQKIKLSTLKSHPLFSDHEFNHFKKRGDTHLEIMAFWDHRWGEGQREPTQAPTNKTIIGQEMSCILKPFHQEYKDCQALAKKLKPAFKALKAKEYHYSDLEVLREAKRNLGRALDILGVLSEDEKAEYNLYDLF